MKYLKVVLIALLISAPVAAEAHTFTFTLNLGPMVRAKARRQTPVMKMEGNNAELPPAPEERVKTHAEERTSADLSRQLDRAVQTLTRQVDDYRIDRSNGQNNPRDHRNARQRAQDPVKP